MKTYRPKIPKIFKKQFWKKSIHTYSTVKFLSNYLRNKFFLLLIFNFYFFFIFLFVLNFTKYKKVCRYLVQLRQFTVTRLYTPIYLWISSCMYVCKYNARLDVSMYVLAITTNAHILSTSNNHAYKFNRYFHTIMFFFFFLFCFSLILKLLSRYVFRWY